MHPPSEARASGSNRLKRELFLTAQLIYWPSSYFSLQELGRGGVEFLNVEDCWARDLRMINSDNGVMVAFVS